MGFLNPINDSTSQVQPVVTKEEYGFNTAIFSLAVLGGSILMLSRLFHTKRESKEPPFVFSKIPIIGHTLGILRHRMGYYTMLSEKYRHDIYALPMFGGRLYVATSPDLVAPIQRYYKDLSFWFLEGAFTVKLGALGKHSSKLLLENAAGREVGNSLVVDGMKQTHASMIAGLEEMNQVAADIIRDELDVLEGSPGGEIDLWKWVDEKVGLMTSGAVYGPMNPYRDPELAKGLRAFSEDSTMLLAGILPSILAPKGYTGREDIVKGFQKYFVTGGHESGSALVRARVKSLSEYGITPEDIARFEAVNGFGILINTLPTAFWSLYHIFSKPNILSSVRDLVQPLLSTTQDAGGNLIHTLDVRKIREIPLLVSIMNESLRYHSSGAAARMVMEDFTLNNRYLLKKNSMLMVPNREIHFHSETWGENVDEFDHFRFMKSQEGGSKKPPTGAFRGFGSGANMCPGKNFATSEILAAVAMMVLRFDITPKSESWENPGDDASNMSTVITTPRDPVPVIVSPRACRQRGQWVFKAAGA